VTSAALPLAFGLAVFLARESQIAGTRGFPLDDPWIHLHFARNLAEGHGFAYNPGVPVSGSTAPLWTLLLAGLFTVTGPSLFWVKALGALCALGTALLTQSLVRAWSGDDGAARLAGAATALSGPMLWGALSGMEVSLAALLVVMALVAHARSRTWAPALCLGLAVLARPEASLLVPLVWLAGPRTTRRAALLFGTAAVLVAPWVLFSLATVGAPLPATAVVKIRGGLVGLALGAQEPLTLALLGRPLRYVADWVRLLFSINAVVALGLLPGLLLLWAWRGWHDALPALVLLAHPLGMALLAPYYGPAFQGGRHSLHLLPVAIAGAAMGLLWIPRRAGPTARRWARRVALGALLMAPALTGLWPAAGRYAWAVQNTEAMQVDIGRWVERHTPRDARVALTDAGAIAYVSRRFVVDLAGLVTPEAIPYRRAGEAGGRRFLERTCPDYLIVFPRWSPGAAAEPDHFRPVYRVRLDHNVIAAADELVVYETAWSRSRPDPKPCGTGLGAGPGPPVGRPTLRPAG
jgi:hypothetical protein